MIRDGSVAPAGKPGEALLETVVALIVQMAA